MASRRSGSSFSATFSPRRLLVFATVAAFYIAPAIGMWFSYLNSISLFDGFSNFNKALGMMFIDQTIGAVLINMGFFVAFEFVQQLYPPYPSLRSNFLAEAQKSIRSNFWITMKTNWMCWPLINFVNFLVIPLRYRLLFLNFFAVAWNMFLSGIANK